MGQLTNQLAAFPSLHAGWALWVALVVRRNTHNYWLRGLAWLHAAITATVVIGTGNHWILDVAVGWAVVIIAMWLVDPWFLDGRGPEEVRLEFHDRIADVPHDARTAHPDSSQRESDAAGARRARAAPGLSAALRQRPLTPGQPEDSSAASRARAWRARSPSYVVHIGGRLALRNEP